MTKCDYKLDPFQLGQARVLGENLLFLQCLKHHLATLARAEAQSDPA